MTILCEMLDGIPQTTANRSIRGNETPGLTSIGDDYFCEDVDAVEKALIKNIEVVLTPQKEE